MKTKKFKQHAWAWWFHSLCLIIVLAAVPRIMSAEVIETYDGMGYIKGISVKPESVGLGTTAYTVEIPMIYSGDNGTFTWSDFEIYIDNHLAATMSGLGYEQAKIQTKPMLMGKYEIPSSWNSSRPTQIWGNNNGMYSTSYGHLQFYACGSATNDNKITITIVPERIYTSTTYYDKEHVTVRVLGKSKSLLNEMGYITGTAGYTEAGIYADELHEVTVSVDIDDSKLGFVRTNKGVVYRGSFDRYENYKYAVDLYEDTPKFESSTTPASDLPDPIYTSDVTDFGATSLNMTFEGLTLDNKKSVTLYPVIRYINNSVPTTNGIAIAPVYYNFQQMMMRYVGPVILPGYAYAKNVKVEYNDVYKKWTKITWEADGEGDNYDKDGKWYIYRQEAGVENAEIECLGSTNYDKLEFRDENKEGHLEYGGKYTYTVCFIPNGWDSDSYKNAEGLYCQKDFTFYRTFEFGSNTGEAPELYTTSERNKNEIVFHWTHTAIGDASSKSYKLYVDRTLTPDDDISWVEQTSFDIKSANTTSGSYTDKNGLELYETYYYRLRINVQDSDFVSAPVAGSLDGGSEITNITASRGTFSSVVKLQWNVKQVGSNKSFFVLSRRPLGSTNDAEFTDIYNTSGTDDLYSYDDATARSGSYYEYRVRIYALHNGEQKGAMSMSTDGYCIQTGVLSGRVYYGTGTAVEGVKVLLKPNDGDGEILNKFRAIELATDSSSIAYKPGYDKIGSLLGNDFSMQMYVNPATAGASGEEKALIAIPGALYVTLRSTSVEGKQKYEVCYRTDEQGTGTGLGVYVNENEWSNLSLAYSRKGKELTAYVVACKEGSKEAELMASEKQDNVVIAATEPDGNGENGSQAILIGDAFGSNCHYKGLVDEFRFWTKTLTQADVEKNYFHTLSGSENKLAIYWPMDEGMQRQVVTYDLSQTNDAANECHAVVNNAGSSENIPDEEMLSLCALTDGDGNYVLRGVPFSGIGTNYVVTPVFGIHEFSPSSASCYLSGQSTVHSGMDFTDASSFPVSGRVLYEGTTIPVEGAYLYVDGIIASRDGQAVMTDENGEYSVDVPIGDHFVEVKSNGHEFLNGGRYPVDPDGVGAKHTFESAVSNVNFTDQTRVVVAGRVAGGDVENEKPLGVGAGKANIGQAKIELSFVGSDRYWINAELVTNGLSQNYEISKERLTYQQASDSIASEVYVEGGKNVITIKTDPKTGEWSALLPPLKYTADKITIPTQPEIDFSNKLFTLNAVNPMALMTDSIESEQEELDGYARFKYVDAAKVAYKAPSNLDVTENEDGSFGERLYTVTDDDGSEELTLYTVDENGNVDYKFDAPIYLQKGEYNYNIFAYERYANKDGKETVYDLVPLPETKVTIKNEFASTTSVVISDGTVHEMESNSFELDSLGRGTYRFNVGLPNIMAPYTRTLNISYDVDGTEISWDQNGKFKAIVLGGLAKGNNFVTQGPDKVLMVLRDPPGTNSSATWTQGSVVVTETSRTFSRHSNTSVGATMLLGADVTTSTGVGVAVITDMKSKYNQDAGFSIDYSEDHGNSSVTTTTLTTDISTDDTPDYVGANGDLFIGNSTNLILGAVNSVDIRKTGGGLYGINSMEALSVSEKFGTSFVYTQAYIEDVLIPRFEEMRNQCLEYVENGDVFSKKRPADGKPRYVTTIKPDDKNFGSPNNSVEIWEDKAVVDWENVEPTNGYIVGPSYTIVLPEKDESFVDTIQYYNEQIQHWVETLKNNEKAKVYAIENRSSCLKKNYSFDSGAAITETDEIAIDSIESDSKTYDYNFHAGGETGFTFNGFGLKATWTEDAGMTYVNNTTTTHTNIRAFSYTLSEDGNNDYLSVDVLKSNDGFSPIFFTHAGATSGPFEDEVVTKYYEPGKVIQRKTLQIEKPEMSVLDPIVTGVPAGKEAKVRIVLRNNSETNSGLYYGLKVMPATNANGAQIYMDGKNIATGIELLLQGGEQMQKTLTIRQSDEDILEYDDIVLRMYSLSQPEDGTGNFPGIYSDQTVSVHFQPSCTDINLATSANVVNTDTEDPIILSMNGYDYNQVSFQEIRLQYKGENDANFKNLKVFVKDNEDGRKKKENDKSLDFFHALNGTDKLTYSLDLRESDFSDQTYVFRAQTVGYRGGNEVTNESEEIRIVRDMSRPQLITNPTPTNGVLNAGGSITLTFNEDINHSILTKTGNFVVTGSMNETEVAHEVALELTGSGAAKTAATIDLSNRPFSANLWIYYTADGTILQHGTAGNCFTASVRDGKLILAVGKDEVVSDVVLPTGKWLFLSFNYDNSGIKPVVSASYAQDADIVTLFESREISEYDGNGPLAVGGNGMKARVQELTLWNSALNINDALASRNKTKNPYTSGLIGYWQLGEGHGTVATDRARSRDLTLPSENAWFINGGTNYAVRFDGETVVESPVSTTAGEDDSYMVELWFNIPATGSKNQTIVSLSKFMDVNVNTAGQVVTTIGGASTVAYATNVCDGQWHHLALNVLKGSNGSASLYIDGMARRQFGASSMPSLGAAGHIVLGARQQMNGEDVVYDQYMTGSIDELRVWNGRRTAEVIKSTMYQRVVNDAEGLEAYYPMEVRTLDGNGQIYTAGTELELKANNMSGLSLTSNKDLNFTTEAPSLSSAPSLENVQFDFVASERQITINLGEEPYKIENCNVNLTVKNVKDLNGNSSQPITWTVFVQQNQMTWSEKQVTIETVNGQSDTIFVEIENSGAVSDSWALKGVPSWLSVNVESGNLAPQASQKLRFIVDPSIAVGNYESTIYLTGSQNIDAPLNITLHVKGNEPNWTPRPDEDAMMIVGQVVLDGIISSDPNDMLAAFRGQECVGVARPTYNSRYDAYFITMNVYGNTQGAELTYKFYDASSGTIYPSVTASKDGVYTFKASTWVGSFNNEEYVIFNPENKIEQDLSLERERWKWFSMYVTPDDKSVASVFKDASKSISTIKDSKVSAMTSLDGTWNNAFDMTPETMYKLHATEAFTETAIGTPIDPEDVCITLSKNWTWIGYPLSSSNSLASAFADADPQPGDVVMGQSSFAMYIEDSWMGSLTSMMPGEGYKYYSTAGGSKEFHYQKPSAANKRIRSIRKASDALVLACENNMAVIATVEKNGMKVEDAVVRVYAGDVLCGYSPSAEVNGLHFITVGDMSNTKKLTMVVEAEGETYVLNGKLNFAADAIIGTAQSPFVINISEATNVDSETFGKSVERIEYYDLSGSLVSVDEHPASVNVGRSYNGAVKVAIKRIVYTDGTATVFKIVDNQ